MQHRNGSVSITASFARCELDPPPSNATLPGGVSIKNGPRNMRNSCVPRGANGERGTPYCSPNTSCTLRRLEDDFNQGTIIPRQAIQVPSDQPAVSLPRAARFVPFAPFHPSTALPLLPGSVLTRITVGITSATPSAMLPLQVADTHARDVITLSRVSELDDASFRDNRLSRVFPSRE